MNNNLKKIRKEKGVTQDQLAHAVGATKRQIGAWERGENELPMDYADSIAEYFGCSIDVLAGRVTYAMVDLDNNEVLWSTERVSSDEAELLRLYRLLPDKGKHAVVAGMRDFASQ